MNTGMKLLAISLVALLTVACASYDTPSTALISPKCLARSSISILNVMQTHPLAGNIRLKIDHYSDFSHNKSSPISFCNMNLP